VNETPRWYASGVPMKTNLRQQALFALLVLGCRPPAEGDNRETAEEGMGETAGTSTDASDTEHDTTASSSTTPDTSTTVTTSSDTTDPTDPDDRGEYCPSGPWDDGPVASTHKIKNLTGEATSSGQFGVGGTDLGIAVRQPNGQIAYIFGDTFATDCVGGPGWRAPVLLRSDPGLDEDGIEFNGAAGGAYAKQLFDYSHDGGRTWLPSDAITIGQRMYLHYIVNEGLGNVLWTQIAYSDDDGENWTISEARWEADENDFMRQLWTWERGCDGYVYTLSTKFISRDRAIILHRVPEDQILDRDAYEPWGYADDQWAWGNSATIVLAGEFGEMSLRRVEHKWVLAWFNAGEYEITIKVFDGPTSNLYTAATYHPIQGGAWGAESTTVVAQLYGGYIHPDSTLRNLHLIVSQWNTDTGCPYHAMQFVTGLE
jgi:hypothetical protein